VFPLPWPRSEMPGCKVSPKIDRIRSFVSVFLGGVNSRVRVKRALKLLQPDITRP